METALLRSWSFGSKYPPTKKKIKKLWHRVALNKNLTGGESWGCRVELKRLEMFAGTWPCAYSLPGSCVTSAFGKEWSRQERCGETCSHILKNITHTFFLIPIFIIFDFVLGGLFNCHISICDAGGASGPWPHVTGGQRRNRLLPLPRHIAPPWPSGMTPLYSWCLSLSVLLCL